MLSWPQSCWRCPSLPPPGPGSLRSHRACLRLWPGGLGPLGQGPPRTPACWLGSALLTAEGHLGKQVGRGYTPRYLPPGACQGCGHCRKRAQRRELSGPFRQGRGPGCGLEAQAKGMGHSRQSRPRWSPSSLIGAVGLGGPWMRCPTPTRVAGMAVVGAGAPGRDSWKVCPLMKTRAAPDHLRAVLLFSCPVAEEQTGPRDGEPLAQSRRNKSAMLSPAFGLWQLNPAPAAWAQSVCNLNAVRKNKAISIAKLKTKPVVRPRLTCSLSWPECSRSPVPKPGRRVASASPPCPPPTPALPPGLQEPRWRGAGAWPAPPPSPLPVSP